MTDQNERTIDQYYAAMRSGRVAEDQMMALFADDATYEEPFSGLDPAVGRAAILERMRSGWEAPLPELELDVLSVSVDGTSADTTWECRSTVFEQPVRGRDRYEFSDGLITNLRVVFDTPAGNEPAQNIPGETDR